MPVGASGYLLSVLERNVADGIHRVEDARGEQTEHLQTSIERT